MEVFKIGDAKKPLKITQFSRNDIITFFFKNYHSALTKKAVEIVGHSIAEDIVQDTFTLLNINLSKLKSEAKIVNFLLKNIKNACDKYLELCEARRHQEHFSISLNEPDSFIEYVLLERMNQFVDMLPPQQKKVIILLYWKNYSSNEIAIALNISRQTVLNQKMNGLNKIRKHVETVLNTY